MIPVGLILSKVIAKGVGYLLKEFPKKNDLKLGVFSEPFPYSCLKCSIKEGQNLGRKNRKDHISLCSMLLMII
jgi:hypothetical protein